MNKRSIAAGGGIAEAVSITAKEIYPLIRIWYGNRGTWSPAVFLRRREGRSFRGAK